MSALPIDLPAGLVIDLRDSISRDTVSRDSLSSETAPAPAETLHTTAVVSDPILSASIAELVADEADLSYQAYLGDLHPANAMRLAAISAELDRRWSTFA